MTNFTPKMTHTGSVFDLIAFVIIIINDNNSTAAVPQGPSWDQGSVLIGIEHTEKTNLALRSLHLSWRRHTKCREKEVVLSLFCLKTERLSDLPEVRQIFGGRSSTEMCSKLPGVGDQAGHTFPPFKNALAHAQQGGLQAGSRAVQDSKGRIPKGEWPALDGGGGEHLATRLLERQVHGTSCSNATNQTSCVHGFEPQPASSPGK